MRALAARSPTDATRPLLLVVSDDGRRTASPTGAAQASRAWLATERGSASAAQCAATASEALLSGDLLDAAGHNPAYHQCVLVLVMTDAVDAARRAIDVPRDRAMARGSRAMRAAAAWYDSELALRAGNMTQAERLAAEALEWAGEEHRRFTGALRVFVCALAERSAFAEADEQLWGAPPESATLLHARARLLVAEGRFEEAYAAALEVGTRRGRQDRTNPTWDGWRSTAALALAHAGRRHEARALATQLFLSIKTVETHLAAAYRKLGVASRRDLAPALTAPRRDRAPALTAPRPDRAPP